MTIKSFATAVEKLISRQRPSSARTREADFELRHVIRPVWKLASKHPKIHVCVHPCPPRETCSGGCKVAAGHPSHWRRGCPDCWHDSKERSTVRAYGLQHTFDLVARDARKDSMAVEVKWLAYSAGGRGPNSEFQRFIGQCTLAAARHEEVVGVCVISGQRRQAATEAQERLEKALENKLSTKLNRIGVRLVILRTAQRRKAG